MPPNTEHRRISRNITLPARLLTSSADILLRSVSGGLADWLEKGIADLQSELWEGTNEGEGFPPLTFFEALLLTAQFERAINFLRKKQMGVQAVHFVR